MTSRRVLFILAVALCAAVAVSACSQDTKHRVLCFFFDGVPGPGEKSRETTTQRATPQKQDMRQLARAIARGEGAAVKNYPHEPWRKDRCSGCHDMFRGMTLSRPVEDGLCLTCHTDFADELRFLHGPVAVNACLQCHLPHWSKHRNLLVDAPNLICDPCHNRSDLGADQHRDMGKDRTCTQCHDPHGGSDRFFRRQDDR